MNRTFEVRTTTDDKKIATNLPYEKAIKLAISCGYTQRGEPKAIILREVL